MPPEPQIAPEEQSALPHLPESPHGCPMDAMLRLLAGQWTTYILWTLHQNGPTRFGELKRRVGTISAKVLTDRLKMLADAGVIHRHYEPTVPPQVTYSLTGGGEELMDVFNSLEKLAQSWAKKKR